jgi:hypothetical protein
LVNNYAAKVSVLALMTKEIEVALYEIYFLLYEMRIYFSTATNPSLILAPNILSIAQHYTLII